MIPAGIVLISIGALASLLFFFIILPRYFEKDYLTKVDKLENGIIIPITDYTKSIIPFYSINDEGLLKINFVDSVSYLEITIILWDRIDKRIIKHYAISPDDENTISIKLDKKYQYSVIYVNKVDEEKYSDSFPLLVDIEKKSKIASTIVALMMILIGVGVCLLTHGAYARLRPGIIALIYILTVIVSIATGFVFHYFVSRKYLPHIEGGRYLND